jgi:hypothetical protein
MKEFQEILKEKRDYYGNTEAAIEFAAEEYARQYRISILEEVELGFRLCSDTSAFCLGYRNLVDKIRREKANQPIDKSISPIKPYTDNNE